MCVRLSWLTYRGCFLSLRALRKKLSGPRYVFPCRAMASFGSRRVDGRLGRLLRLPNRSEGHPFAQKSRRQAEYYSTFLSSPGSVPIFRSSPPLRPRHIPSLLNSQHSSPSLLSFSHRSLRLSSSLNSRRNHLTLPTFPFLATSRTPLVLFPQWSTSPTTNVRPSVLCFFASKTKIFLCRLQLGPLYGSTPTLKQTLSTTSATSHGSSVPPLSSGS